MSKVNRRRFVRNSVGTLFAARYFGASDLFARGKPTLTDESVNKHFTALRRSKEQFDRGVSEAKRNLAGYLEKHFNLTPEQVENIRGLPREDMVELRRGLDQAVNDNLSIKLMGVERQECARVLLELTPDELIIEVR